MPALEGCSHFHDAELGRRRNTRTPGWPGGGEIQVKGIALVALALAAVFLFAATGAQAKATFVTGTDCGPSPTSGTPAKEWVDDDGIDHARGVPYTDVFTGDFPTTVSGVEGWNIDTATGAGDVFGTMTGTVEGYGTFSGRFTATYFVGGTFVGHATLVGSSGLLTADFDAPSEACSGLVIVHATILSH